MEQLKDFGALLERLPSSPTIVLHSACSQPQRLAALLASHAGQLRGARIVTLMPMAPCPYAEPAALRHAKVLTFFPGTGLRAAAKSGAVEVTRVPLSRLGALFDSGQWKADLLLLRLAPPGDDGLLSLGVSVDYMPSVLAQRPAVVAEIDPSVPWTHGDTHVAAAQVAYFTEPAEPVAELALPREGEVDARIAEHIAQLVPQGAILQVGIGAIPEAVLPRLAHLRGLGLHSGTITDAVLPLFAGGNITGRSVVTMATGTQALYRHIHRNPGFELRACSYTHNPAVIAKLPKVHAINSALQVDLAGCVDGERAAGVTIAGPGGLPDFAQGASQSAGGASIVALRATSRDGATSMIRTKLDARWPATVPGEHVDYVVTEYGVARIRGLEGAARARAIAGIAHPDFRRELLVGF